MSNKILQFISLFFLFTALPAQADTTIISRVTGKILLQVESHGEAWHVNPKNQKKYFLGRPENAFNLMKIFGIGITNNDLNKIPVSLTDNLGVDDDADGLSNNLEQSLGTDPTKTDSDNDGYNDKTEILNNYDPLGAGKPPININFAKKNAGKIFLQVESRGESWYINPTDNKRYFLSNSKETLAIIRKLGLGINNNNLEKIVTGYFYNQPAEPATSTCPNCLINNSSEETIYKTGEAIRENNANKVAAYFIKSMEPIIKYTMNFLTPEGRLIWSEMLSGSSLLNSNGAEKIYHNYVYFQGEKIEIKYYVKKQPDGTWLMTNL